MKKTRGQKSRATVPLNDNFLISDASFLALLSGQLNSDVSIADSAPMRAAK